MAEIVTLKTEERTRFGSANSRRMRNEGRTPAVLYGKKRDNLNFTLTTDDLERAIRARTRVFQLDLPSGTESAMIRELQIDRLTDEILHVDFGRVDLDELIEVDVTIKFVGDAKGVSSGGHLEWQHHSLRIACKAALIPDFIRYDISDLKLGGFVRVADLPLPEGSKTDVDPETIIVACKSPHEDEAPEEEGDGEPEVIAKGKKEADEE